MRPEQARYQFAQIVAAPEADMDLARAALLYACDEYPALDLEGYLQRLEVMALVVRERVPAHAEPTDKVHALNAYLFDELGFRGNRDNYYDPANSYLNEVMERRAGIPITLSVLYLELGRRLQVPLVGVGMPGHFLVKYAGSDMELYIDPFNGGMLMTEGECAGRFHEVYQGVVGFRREFLARATSRQILLRMLTNLKGIYVGGEDWARALHVQDKILLLNPLAAEQLRDMGIICYHNANFHKALECFQLYLQLAPHAPDARLVRRSVAQLRRLTEEGG